MRNVSELEIKMVREDGFDEAFNECLASGISAKTSFQILNVLYRKTYGIDRYSSYDSYRVMRSRRLKSGT